MNCRKSIYAVIAVVVCTIAARVSAVPTGMSDPHARYATDAYPGFDLEESILPPAKKTPKWFAFWNGPDRANAAEQFAYCEALAADGKRGKAEKQFDALVRQWPASPEAAKAQQRFAELLLDEGEYIDAFAEFKYLLDYYSSQCDYNKEAATLYRVAQLMREEGKTVVFFHFDNTVDVRRAFEAVVVRAPGAEFAAKAMLTVAELREEEGKCPEAVAVYENLRNVHGGTPEAKTALYREAKARMTLLREHDYNRPRCRDTISFLKLALQERLDDAVKAELEAWLDEASSLIEEEAYLAAKFYDARTRTKRSAINAYEKFLREYPASAHTEEIRARLAELKGDAQ